MPHRLIGVNGLCGNIQKYWDSMCGKVFLFNKFYQIYLSRITVEAERTVSIQVLSEQTEREMGAQRVFREQTFQQQHNSYGQFTKEKYPHENDGAAMHIRDADHPYGVKVMHRASISCVCVSACEQSNGRVNWVQRLDLIWLCHNSYLHSYSLRHRIQAANEISP